MSIIEIVNGIIVIIGLPTAVGVLVMIGRKLEKLDNVETNLRSLEIEVKDTIRPDLQDIRERFAALEGKVQGIMAGASPLTLTPKGEEILNNSGLKKYINTNKELLMESCRKINSMSNPYDVQTASFQLFDEYEFEPEIETRLKETAYNSGIDLGLMRRIGALYFRDVCLQDLNYDVGDLDKDDKISA